MPYELILGILLGSIFAALISFGPGRELTHDANGRVLLGATGFLIALGTYGLWRRDLWQFLTIGLWFMACCAPVLVGGVVSGIRERREFNRKLEQLQAEQARRMIDLELSHNSVYDIHRNDD